MSAMSDVALGALKGQITVYRTPQKDVYVGYYSAWGHEVASSDSKRFHDWLRSLILARYQVTMSRGDCKLVGETLAAAALNSPNTKERRVYTRVGWDEASRTLYINLANDHHEMVGIRAGEPPFVVGPNEVPLLFQYADKAKPLPAPQGPSAAALPGPKAAEASETAETLDTLMERVLPPGTTRHQRVLMVAWLLGALHPTGPYPILALGGEPGSAKSYTCRMLRRIVDPATPELLSGVTDSRNLAVAAKHNYCLAFDNLGKLDKKQSDILCRLATGAGIARRSLYTDDELHALDVKRPVLLNGIGEVITEADLVDRSLQVRLPRLADGERRPEIELWRQFEEKLPAILWHLYRAVALALEKMDSLELPPDCRPRMLDFAKFVIAAEPAIGWEPGTFVGAYEASRQEAMGQAITASFPAQALIHWMQVRERARRATTATVEWHGTAQQLQNELESALRDHPKVTRATDWPRKAHVLSRHLQTAAPALRQIGLSLEIHVEGKARRHITYVTPTGVTTWQAFSTFVGPGLADERNGSETSFRAAYARHDPVTLRNRILLRQAGYSDTEINGLTNRLADIIVADFEHAGTVRASYETLYEEPEGEPAEAAPEPVAIGRARATGAA